MKYLFYRVLVPVSVLLLYQCRSSPDDPVPASGDTTVPVRTIRCLSDTAHTYAVALPAGFDSSKRYPVVFVFDPHGDGNLAVNVFREGAFDFGYIVVGSNVIRNGYDRIENALQILVRDVTSRYPVDRNRIYAAGFSGGGRVAQLFSQTVSAVSSIAVMGAGFSLDPSAPLRNKPSMLFIAGNEDFNYLETVNSQKILSAAGVHHYLLEYPGKHAWPDHDIIHDVLQWFEFEAYRRDPELMDKSIIKSYRTSVLQQASLRERDHDLPGAVLILQKGIAFLSDICRTHALEKRLEVLKKSAAYRQALKRKQEALSLEMRLQQGYIAAFAEKDTLWWKNEIHGIDQRIGQSDNALLRPLYSRIRYFISMAAFSYCNGALRQQNLRAAEKYVSIYHIADPANPDVYYFRALLLSEKRQYDEAIRQYQKAIGLGFSDFNKAQLELPKEVYSIGDADN